VKNNESSLQIEIKELLTKIESQKEDIEEKIEIMMA
jgi:hypothetical protein